MKENQILYVAPIIPVSVQTTWFLNYFIFPPNLLCTARVYIFHILSPIFLWTKYVFYRFGICYLVVPLFDLSCCYDNIFISGICLVCVAKFNCQMWKSLSPISCGKLHLNTCISLWLMFEIEYKYFLSQTWIIWLTDLLKQAVH